MSGAEETAKRTVKTLKRLNLSFLDCYKAHNSTALQEHYAEGILSDESLENALEHAIYRKAMQYYTRVFSSQTPADTVEHPAYLAFGIKKGLFCLDEVKTFRFTRFTDDTAVVNGRARQAYQKFVDHYYESSLPRLLKKHLLGHSDLPAVRQPQAVASYITPRSA